jgi:hypothetical protein
LFEYFVQRDLQNKNLLKAGDEQCHEKIGKPIELKDIAGLWIILGAGVILGIPVYILYRRYIQKK